MTIQRGDCVRPKVASDCLPKDSVWRVVFSAGELKLEPGNDVAKRVGRSVFDGFRFSAQHFDKVVRCRGQWVSVRDDELLLGPAQSYGDCVQIQPEAQPNSLFSSVDTVAGATFAAEQAAKRTAAIGRLLEDARKLEAERREKLRIAKAAEAKAEKEAVARAKAGEARKALAAKLHADRCLAEAGLELIAEVSRLNNGGSEQVADASIAQYAGQLQELAKSYGYRIVKPSMLAQVVKL